MARFPDAIVTDIDTSETFLTAARDAVPAARFVSGDVTRPLPGTPYDLVYARFLLAHLPDVGATMGPGSTPSRPGGVAVLEETEHIASTDAWFRRYEALW